MDVAAGNRRDIVVSRGNELDLCEPTMPPRRLAAETCRGGSSPCYGPTQLDSSPRLRTLRSSATAKPR